MSLSVEELQERKVEIFENVARAAKKVGRSPDSIKVIAVSKTHPIDYIYSAIEAEISVFGENYAQELKDKMEEFDRLGKAHPEWHFIGHLQSNKVKYIAKDVAAIHSVDKMKLASEIDKRAAENNRKIDIMLQVNTSGEESKFGCEPDDVFELSEGVLKLQNVNLKGLMTIGTFTDDETQQRKEFSLLRELKDRVNTKFNLELNDLSMGMTNDYPVAIEEGATMVRIGTAFFGQRNYNR